MKECAPSQKYSGGLSINMLVQLLADVFTKDCAPDVTEHRLVKVPKLRPTASLIMAYVPLHSADSPLLNTLHL